jgi:hypothetical protein
VIQKGDDLPSGKNHADYIDPKRKYDIVRYMQDHKENFFGMSKAFIGTLAPHITTEVDCESLFSQAGHAAHPNRNKHRLSRIYCSQNKVKKEFLDLWKKNAWSEKEDRDDFAFWE